MINEQILVEKGLMIQTTHYFTNYFLVAMPVLTDAYFNRSVVYICEHTEKGAVGIVINQPLQSLRVNLSEILQDIRNSKSEESAKDIAGTDFPILCGGPVHPERGFVIHAPAGEWQSSLKMSCEISVTTSKDILLAIAKQQGPDKFIFSLGYANWIAGQMEEEIVNNFWLTLPASPNILFDIPFEQRWSKAMNHLGVDVTKLAYMGGHA
ncbi:YqgE/AlgH family protein [Rickettsiella endosymbiont of Miltochrista miniata]|uniref:YqgE/AlgH family protein n=1 Tax=Rickettsiella endosymbiont of Miltochrista miniata TaxID=3066239 RepID=UPI00313C4B50